MRRREAGEREDRDRQGGDHRGPRGDDPGLERGHALRRGHAADLVAVAGAEGQEAAEAREATLLATLEAMQAQIDERK